MPGQIFNIQNDGTLVEMNEQSFANEDIFQDLLAKYPNLLAGDQVQVSSPRRWLLVKREMGVPGEQAGGKRWSLDHLFLDQDAIPTLVEVKRSTDTRLRREVVGQMLDYAANAVVYWPVEKVQNDFERTCAEDGVDSEKRLATFLGEDANPDEFWQKVKTNLQAGRIRMLFVADVIPSELRRIVEFLNEQMDPAEVLAIEIKHYVGQGLKTLVPRVIGLTAEAEQRKSVGTGQPRTWDWASFVEVVEQKWGKDLLDVAVKIMEWVRQNGFSVRYGRGKVYPSFFVTVRCGGKPYDCIAVFGGFICSFRLYMLQQCPAFADEQRFRELHDQIAGIAGVTFEEKDYPSVPLPVFQDKAALDQLFEILKWVRDCGHDAEDASVALKQ